MDRTPGSNLDGIGISDRARRSERDRRRSGDVVARALACTLLVTVLPTILVSCGPPTVDDPIAALENPEKPARLQRAALDVLDASDAIPGEDQLRTLRGLLWRPGYVVDVREQAYQRLARVDESGLVDTLKLRLPRLDALAWRKRVCELIAADDRRELVPTLVSAWATPVAAWQFDEPETRPEYLALRTFSDDGDVSGLVLETLADANPFTQEGLQARCWELMVRNGESERLKAWLDARSDAEVARNPFLRDMRLVVRDLDITPDNREEVLWARALVQPERAAFVRQLELVLDALPPSRRADLELRSLPVVVATARTSSERLTASDEELFTSVRARVDGRRSRQVSPSFEGFGDGYTESLLEARRKLTFGDLLTLHLVLDALEIDALRAHFFDQADRDLQDRSTEYGGLLDLDDRDRLVLREFPPRRRVSDTQFHPSPEQFEEGYTAIAHLHYHATKYDNERHAGPHMGDFGWANSTRANGVVLSFLDSRTLNVDFYRHGPLVIDLGSISR